MLLLLLVLLLLLWRKISLKSKKHGTKKKRENRPQESWDIAAPRTRTNPSKKFLVSCAFELCTWDVVVVVVVVIVAVVRINKFSVDDVLCLLLLFTVYE